MHIKTSGRRFTACLLLCSLFLIGCSSYGISPFFSAIYSDANGSALSSVSGSHKHSSMSGGVYSHLDYREASNDCAEFCLFSAGQSRWQNLKVIFPFLAAAAVAHMAYLIYYSRLSDEIYTQLNSNKISAFLHKKDGMK